MLGFQMNRLKMMLWVAALSVAVVGNAYARAQSPAKKIQPQVIKPVSETVATPALLGKTKAAADLVLKNAGLKMGKTRYAATGRVKPGRVVKQQPRAKTIVAKGSAVDIWLLRKAPEAAKQVQKTAQALPNARIFPSNKTLFMEFPRKVGPIVISDDRGNVLQKFNGGRRFNITPSLMKTKAGQIFVSPQPPSGGVPRRLDVREDLYRRAYRLDDHHSLYRRFLVIDDDSTIDRHEPANNTITGAPLLSAGYFSGQVGGDDATDYLKATATSGGVGTLVQVEVKSGSVQLHYYYPNRSRIDGYTDKFWIALAPGTTFYFQVSPTGAASTDYRISVSKKRLTDAYEANDTFAQAKVLGTGRTFLGNVINGSSNHVGVSDFFQFNVPAPQNLRIQVTHAGLASGNQVEISLYNRNNTHVTSQTGNAGGCTLNHDLRPAWPHPDEHPVFPAGQWRVEVRTPTAGGGYPEAYGNGDPPACYTSPTGYSLSITVLP